MEDALPDAGWRTRCWMEDEDGGWRMEDPRDTPALPYRHPAFDCDRVVVAGLSRYPRGREHSTGLPSKSAAPSTLDGPTRTATGSVCHRPPANGPVQDGAAQRTRSTYPRITFEAERKHRYRGNLPWAGTRSRFFTAHASDYREIARYREKPHSAGSVTVAPERRRNKLTGGRGEGRAPVAETHQKGSSGVRGRFSSKTHRTVGNILGTIAEAAIYAIPDFTQVTRA